MSQKKVDAYKAEKAKRKETVESNKKKQKIRSLGAKIAGLVIAAGIYAVSRFSRTPEKARMTAMVIFLLPSALAESGIEQLQLLNCVRLLSFPLV